MNKNVSVATHLAAFRNVENIAFLNLTVANNSTFTFENNNTEIIVNYSAIAHSPINELKQSFSSESPKEIIDWLAAGHEKNRWALNSFSEEFTEEYRSIIKKTADKINKHVPKKWLQKAKSVAGFSIDIEKNRLAALGNTDYDSTLAFQIATDTFKAADTSNREVVAQSYRLDAYIFTIGGSLIIAGILGKLANVFATFQCVAVILSSSTWASLFIGIIAAYQCFASILALIFNNTYIAAMLMVSVVSGLLMLGYDPKKLGFFRKNLEFPSIFSRNTDEQNESLIRANLEAFSANIHKIFNQIPENNMKMIPIEDYSFEKSKFDPISKREEDKYLRKMYHLDLGASNCLSGITNIFVGIELESFRFVRFAFKIEPEQDGKDAVSLLSMGFKDEMVLSLHMDVAELMADFETRFSAVQFYPFFLKKFTKITATMAKDIVYDTIRFKVHDTFKITKYLAMAARALNEFHEGLTVSYEHGKTVELF